MSLRRRRLLGLALLPLSLVALSSAPAEPPPVFLTQWGTTGTGNGQFDHPTDLAVHASNHIYVADADNDRIQKFGPPLDFFIGEPEPPSGH